MRFCVLLSLFVSELALAGGVYVCKQADGSTLYSQMPCPSGSVTAEKKTIQATAPQSSFSTPDLDAMADDVANNNRRLEAERKIRSAERRLTKLEKERESIVSRGTELANSIAGVNAANRSQAVVDQMNAERKRVDEAINREKEVINSARESMESARSPNIEQHEDGSVRLEY